MAEPEVEAAWRAEFERVHDTAALQGSTDDPLAALRWSGDAAEVRRLQEEHTQHYLQWLSVGAFAAVIVGVIGVGLSFFH